MRNRIVFGSLTAVSLLFFSACNFIGNCIEGEGQIVSQQLNLDDFNSIELHHSVVVYLEQSESKSVSIKAQQNIIDLLKTEVENENWQIQFDRCPKTDQKIEVYINNPEFKAIEIEGSGQVIGKNLLKSHELELIIDGSGDIQLELDVKELASEISGSGDLILEGSSKLHDIEINGSGDIKAYDLATEETNIEINGSGDVRVNVNYALDVEINGSGDVFYKGDVKKIGSNINGSGKLKQKD